MKCLHNGGLISRLNLEKVEKMIFCVLIDYRKLILMVFLAFLIDLIAMFLAFPALFFEIYLVNHVRKIQFVE
jgi:hypothetical protein